jgi:hypothetical protein
MTCSICQHGTMRDYHKQLMGGVPGVVCWYCFLAWYEVGLITDIAIRRESIIMRESIGALQERGAR